MGSTKIAFIGLGAMGFGMATTLLRSGFDVKGYDVWKPTLDRFIQAGGVSSASPAEATKDAAILILMVVNSDQANDVLYGEFGALSVLPEGGVVIICSTVAPAYVRNLEKNLPGRIFLVDAPVSGGVSRAANGTLTIMAAGTTEALEKAKPVLSALSEKLYIVGDRAGAGSTVKMINQLLAGVHIAVAAEAMAMGARAGINTRILYDIISNAAGSSWIFVNRVPHMLDGDFFPHSALDIFVKDLGIVLTEGKATTFALPLAAAAHQQFILGSSAGYGREDDAAVVKVWEKVAGVVVAAPKLQAEDTLLVRKVEEGAVKPEKIAFIGLGAMGLGMATSLLKRGFLVHGFDVYPPSMAKFGAVGGRISTSPADAANGSEIVIIMVTNEEQAENALFSENGVVSALARGSTVIISSTVSPDYIRKLEARLTAQGHNLVDAPVSGGVAKAANGSLTIMASGSDEALAKATTVLAALSEKLYIINGGAGAGSTVKMINQLLAGVHIAVAAEAMAFGARNGLDTQFLFEILSNAAGSSWMFVNRVPHMLNADYTPYSALDIFVKDLDIVTREAKRLCISVPLASCAHQLFMFGSAAGFGREDDAAVVKVYEKLTGVTVRANTAVTPASKSTLLSSLPPEWDADLTLEIRKANTSGDTKVLVVLDDDPTGTQTVHGVTVLTEWSIDSLKAKFQTAPSCFFILTNSRALSTDEAYLLTKEICGNVATAAALVGNVGFTIVLRGDSTLRGHFPQEVDAASSVIGESDAWIICPFFWQGGRYTINDIHYVADGDMLVPAGQTEFAKDSVFGYKSSNLREWVEEKTKGRVSAKNVASISIETIRRGGPAAVHKQLSELSKGSVCIVNAASEKDILVFAAGIIRAEKEGKRFLCRTAAGFVSARIGITPKPPITPADIGVQNNNGGLVVVGSYVPRTTKQVEELKLRCGSSLECITVRATSVALSSPEERDSEVMQASKLADVFLASGRDTLIVTSRDLVTGKSDVESLDIGSKVSSALVEIVRNIRTRPRYIIAKGGITSSDIATQAMGASRAEVEGQAIAGVPLWKLGPGSRYPDIPYIVFPGNVGGPEALATVVLGWAKPPRKSTKDILNDAEVGGYAVGAFNVYNLEGAMAIVAAAEAEMSPTILQIHPAAFRHGGRALVASCNALASGAKVPVSVHLDHGNDEQEILEALEMGFDSVMVDGSQLSFEDNVAFTKRVAYLAHSRQLAVEAELGRLSGSEDGLTVEEYEAKFTDVKKAKEFIEKSGVDALAVCIGNVHGKYPASGPNLNLDLLKELREITKPHNVALVLHGASGVPQELINACIDCGVRKFNVNTEVRSAYMEALSSAKKKDLVDVMQHAQTSMQAVAMEKMRIFRSSGKSR